LRKQRTELETETKAVSPIKGTTMQVVKSSSEKRAANKEITTLKHKRKK
jgi:DNA gyrase/topoisomerase IV subunit B